MLIASLFLLWIIVILLIVAVVAQSYLRLRSAPPAIRSAPVGLGGAAPVISMPTLAGDMLTVGGVSADARAQLLLFIGPGCPASRTAALIDAQGRLLARGGGGNARTDRRPAGPCPASGGGTGWRGRRGATCHQHGLNKLDRRMPIGIYWAYHQAWAEKGLGLWRSASQ